MNPLVGEKVMKPKLSGIAIDDTRSVSCCLGIPFFGKTHCLLGLEKLSTLQGTFKKGNSVVKRS